MRSLKIKLNHRYIEFTEIMNCGVTQNHTSSASATDDSIL